MLKDSVKDVDPNKSVRAFLKREKLRLDIMREQRHKLPNEDSWVHKRRQPEPEGVEELDENGVPHELRYCNSCGTFIPPSDKGVRVIDEVTGDVFYECSHHSQRY